MFSSVLSPNLGFIVNLGLINSVDFFMMDFAVRSLFGVFLRSIFTIITRVQYSYKCSVSPLNFCHKLIRTEQELIKKKVERWISTDSCVVLFCDLLICQKGVIFRKKPWEFVPVLQTWTDREVVCDGVPYKIFQLYISSC